MALEIKDIDRRIWEEELEGFLPQKIFDGHAHVYMPEFCRTQPGDDPPEGNTWENRPCKTGDRDVLEECFSALLPGREMHYLMIPWVFRRGDYDGLNRFTAAQAAGDPLSAASMVVRPSDTPEQLAEAIDAHGFRGVKPYMYYVPPGDGKNCRITDMFPEPQIEVADERGLVVTLHLGKALAIADEENIEDLVRLSGRYPNVKWVLAHLARCLVPWPLERAIDRIKGLPNVWYDFSSVCNSEVYEIAFRNVPLDRIFYGSDIPVATQRGTYVGFGYAWAHLGEEEIGHLGLSHCDPRPTFILYETLRAARRAIVREGFSAEQIEDLFYHNAVNVLGLS